MSFHRGIFFTLLVLLPTQLGYHMWPSWTLVLGRRVDYLSPVIFATDILVILLLLTWCIEERVWRRVWDRSGYASRTSWIQMVLLGTGVAMFNIWNAHSPTIALLAWIKVVEYTMLGWYIYHTRVRTAFVLAPLAIGMIYSSWIAVAQFFLERSIGGLFWFLGERTFYLDTPGIARITLCNPLSFSCVMKLRAYATFPHPNVLGGYLAVLLPLMLGALFDKKSPARIFLYRVTFISAIAALLFTFSRGAWIVGVLGLWYVFMHHASPPARVGHLQKILLTIMCVLVLLLGFVSAPVQTESVVVRTQLNDAAHNIWSTSPIFGVGLRNFIPTLPSHMSSSGVYSLQPVHNIYVLAATEVGLVGLALFLVVVYRCIKHIADKTTRTSRYRLISSPIIISVGLLLLLGLFDHYPVTIQQGQMLFTVLLSLLLSEQTR